MAFCTQCGSQLPDGAAFCSSCGAQVAQTQKQVAGAAPTFIPPEAPTSASSAAPTFTPPEAPTSTPAAAPTSTPPAAQKFTPPAAPTFTPPAQTFTPPTRTHNGAVCYYHQDEPAVAKCARCGKYICKDCFDSYGVSIGEYAGQALCYDCTQQLVAENVETLKKNKKKITTTFILTIIGMIVGIIFAFSMGAESGSSGSAGVQTRPGVLPILLGAMIGGCFWTFIKCWFARVRGAVAGGGFNIVSIVLGLILGFVIEGVLSIYRTIRKIIECIIYLKRTSGFIESDSAALRQMSDYMEYTLVRNQNRGVDIETLLRENSQLADNSVAQMARTQTEEQIEASMRSCLATINENGEIIRSFAA